MASRSLSNVPRRSLLDLAPLELDCMSVLWPMGEGTVREIRERLAPLRPRAYTTIMTIMDRLARKGVVERRKVGRAYLYRPNLSAADARAHALESVVKSFFGGSTGAVLEQLESSAHGETEGAASARPSRGKTEPENERVANIRPQPASPQPAPRKQETSPRDADEQPQTARMDTTLL